MAELSATPAAIPAASTIPVEAEAETETQVPNGKETKDPTNGTCDADADTEASANANENVNGTTMNTNARLRPELKEKIQSWILSFYHLDPRYKILTFFNLVASEGADNLTDDQIEEHSYAMMTTTSTTGGAAGSLGNSVTSQQRQASPTEEPTTPVSANQSSPASGKIPPANSTSKDKNNGNNRDVYKVNAHLMSRPSARNIRPSTLSLLSRIFNATSILTVWRPCSNDAMRKMMEGAGVGKGLDIKGKSAKKGTLSGFVPFMQIFDNDHKNEIQPIPVKALMRVYYKDEKLRDHVLGVLQTYLEEGPPLKKNGGNVPPLSPVGKLMDEPIITDEVVAFRQARTAMRCSTIDEITEDDDLHNEQEQEEGTGKEKKPSLPDHKNPNSSKYVPPKPLKKLKKYTKVGFYGIECTQRLFWLATVQDADISRSGTGTETGRPSLPGFQDANLKTLKVAHTQLPKPNPMPVVLQYKSYEEVVASSDDEDENQNTNHPLDDCLDPRFLVMAYEEQGTIKPVVSDFDGFLLGWRREALWFGCCLPRYQENLMMWCVERIEEILDDQKKNPTNSDTWTQRWLDVQKKAAQQGKVFDIPEYGFGDPKSTSIMEHAALKLKSTGAVRHGSECFNYHFPQEIDETFLLISDTLKPVPWKYVNVKELQDILSQKIAEGFVFPLNPKWILCDPGWKKVYDDLMRSDALYSDLSKDIWFPPYSGIRERIEKIHKLHPNGFQRCTNFSKAKGLDKMKSHSSTGRRQSASNILRDTLDEGLGSQLTGNAYADLAQLELDDFIGRTSAMPGRGMELDSAMGKNIRDAIKDLSIEELDDDYAEQPRSSKGVGGVPLSQRSRQEKRPSGVSHTSSIASSVGSSGTSQSNSKTGPSSSNNQSPGLSLTSSISSGSGTTPTTFRKLFRKVRRRPNSMEFTNESSNNDQHTTSSEPYTRSKTTSSPDLRLGQQARAVSNPKDSSSANPKKKTSSKDTNKPRRHFSKWFK
ncbi:unnamed protein product [Pseudo-nitzschia multistriata]|uniref:Uncharacterized protein n=1 Tax=Pseudo-nitzschia multistriata TaxID=183589 RepID=A0A448ZPV9_9STRA|nr:unnamed protein product [Pseudo-nitzschia multistriata]